MAACCVLVLQACEKKAFDMPDIDGLEVLEKIREDFGQKMPIIMLTSNNDKDYVLYRDDLLNRHGWIVVRFAEKQIKKYPKSCVLYLVKLIKSLVPQMVIPTDLQSVNPLPPMKRWTKNEAIIMAANGEREKYLDHVFSKTEEIKIELADIRLNENERKCQSLVKASAMSIDMTEKMVNFTDSGVYERDKSKRK